jgi:hypothetical protein
MATATNEHILLADELHREIEHATSPDALIVHARRELLIRVEAALRQPRGMSQQEAEDLTYNLIFATEDKNIHGGRSYRDEYDRCRQRVIDALTGAVTP